MILIAFTKYILDMILLKGLLEERAEVVATLKAAVFFLLFNLRIQLNRLVKSMPFATCESGSVTSNISFYL